MAEFIEGQSQKDRKRKPDHNRIHAEKHRVFHNLPEDWHLEKLTKILKANKFTGKTSPNAIILKCNKIAYHRDIGKYQQQQNWKRT